LALGVRRRGPRRGGDPAPDAQDRRCAGREAAEARRRRRRPLRARARAPRLRCAPLERLGLDPAEVRRPVLGRPLADGLARARGLLVIWIFFRWEARLESTGREPLVRPAMLHNRQLSGGLTMFFFQYLVQAGLFFVVPLYLSVCLGLSALATGARL